LNETYFKYHEGLLEMYDRLLFLTVQNRSEPLLSTIRLPKLVESSKNSTYSLNRTRLQRKAIPLQTGPHEKWDYKMLVTDEVEQLLNIHEHRQDKKRNLFKSSLPFM